jgi:hypothetical protein
MWEPSTGTSHRLPKPVSRKQLDNQVTNNRNSTGNVKCRFYISVLVLRQDRSSRFKCHSNKEHVSIVLLLSIKWCIGWYCRIIVWLFKSYIHLRSRPQQHQIENQPFYCLNHYLARTYSSFCSASLQRPLWREAGPTLRLSISTKFILKNSISRPEPLLVIPVVLKRLGGLRSRPNTSQKIR